MLLLDAALEADGVERLLTERPGFPVALLADRETSRAGEDGQPPRAVDYLTWPLDPYRLRVVLAHAVERPYLMERIRRHEGGAARGTWLRPNDATDGHLRVIDRMEKGAIVDALRRTGGNVREAARLLGFGQATVYRKVKRYKIPFAGPQPLPMPSAPASRPGPQTLHDPSGELRQRAESLV